MNKIKSAKVHLIKFLFVLPLLSLVLISFRDNAVDKKLLSADISSISELLKLSAPVHTIDTVPPPPPPPPAPPLRRNATGKVVKLVPEQLPADVESVQVTQKISVKRKDGKTETFDMSSPEDVKAYRAKYRTLPPPPPMPPVPGREANITSQMPPAAASFNVRKKTAADPLVVIDGVQFPRGTDMNTLVDPDNIESVTVLKDASATALYGAPGANGVVVITTKKDGAGVAKVKNGAAKEPGVVIRGYRAPAAAREGKFTTDLENFDGIIYLNGKEVSKAEISKLDPESISDISVTKGGIDKDGKKSPSATMKISTIQ